MKIEFLFKTGSSKDIESRFQGQVHGHLHPHTLIRVIFFQKTLFIHRKYYFSK